MWRHWEDLTHCPGAAEGRGSQTSSDSYFEFSLMSYNILAQDLLEANPDLYVHCSKQVLVWSTRFKGIVQEIQSWRPDILCLQEAQGDHFKTELEPVLINLGYTCVYKQRTGSKTDGCAICYQSSRFVQVSVAQLELRQDKCELLDRDNVAIVLLLQPTSHQLAKNKKLAPICVATTHLLFNPKRGDIKLAQLLLVMAEVDSVVKRCESMGQACEVVLCGDFNSCPFTPLYHFVLVGELRYHGLPAWLISGQEDHSYQTYPRRLNAPLLPSCIGVNNNCQYVCHSKMQSKPPTPLPLASCPSAPPLPSSPPPSPPPLPSSPPPPSPPPPSSPPPLPPPLPSSPPPPSPPPADFIPSPPSTQDQAKPLPEHVISQELPPVFGECVTHSLGLSSVYSHFINGTDVPEVTTVHSKAGVTVDYIFYSKAGKPGRGRTDRASNGGLSLVGRLSLLSEADLWSLRGLPSDVFPSDHLSLMGKFRMYAAPSS